MTGGFGVTRSSLHRDDPLGFCSEKGLDYGKVVDFLGLGIDDLSRLGGVGRGLIRLDGHLPEGLRVSLEQVANTCAMVAGYFEGDGSKTALWFRMPNPMLGNISPREMIRYGRSRRLLKFVTEARQTDAESDGHRK